MKELEVKTTIYVTDDGKRFNTLDNIEKRHEYEMEKWERFYRYFKNELKKDMENL